MCAGHVSRVHVLERAAAGRKQQVRQNLAEWVSNAGTPTQRSKDDPNRVRGTTCDSQSCATGATRMPSAALEHPTESCVPEQVQAEDFVDVYQIRVSRRTYSNEGVTMSGNATRAQLTYSPITITLRWAISSVIWTIDKGEQHGNELSRHDVHRQPQR
jgi:hypothetical protein